MYQTKIVLKLFSCAVLNRTYGVGSIYVCTGRWTVFYTYKHYIACITTNQPREQLFKTTFVYTVNNKTIDYRIQILITNH